MIKHRKKNDFLYRQLHPEAYSSLIKSTECFRSKVKSVEEKTILREKEHRRILKKGPKRF